MSLSSLPPVAQGVAGTPVTAEMLVVFGLVALALGLFATERFPVDVTAILVMVLLIEIRAQTPVFRRGSSGHLARLSMSL